MKLRKIKENEIASIVDRNKRLRQIHTDIIELRQLVGDDTESFSIVTDCELRDDERPDPIFEFAELSPNSVARSGRQTSNTTETDPLRGNSMQEVFREALDDMMDGVLELSRMEEIKKNPPKPRCVIDDVPENELTDQERDEVQKYREKLSALTAMRTVCIDNLFKEQKQIVDALQLQTTHLDKCIQNALQSKIRTEFAIRSETLRILLASADLMRYKTMSDEERHIQRKRDACQARITELTNTQCRLDVNLGTFKMKYEELQIRDQMLDKQFRMHFAEIVSAVVVEQAHRIYK